MSIRRSTIVLVLFVVIIGGIIGASAFLQRDDVFPPVEITLAVNPMAADWMTEAADRFNEEGIRTTANNRVTVSVTTIDDTDVWYDADSGWTFDSHPVLWLPATSASIDYAPSSMPFQIIRESTARTPLVWGAFADYAAVITQDGSRPLSWGAVSEVIEAQEWRNVADSDLSGFVNMAVEWPPASMGGLAVLFTATGNYHGSDNITGADLSDAGYQAWLELLAESINNSRRLGDPPARAMAARGASVAGFALLPEAGWLLNMEALTRNQEMVFAYPGFQYVLDFPLAMWDNNLTDEQRSAAETFANYLMQAATQQRATAYGLRPATSEPGATAALFAAGLDYGIELQPDYGIEMTTPEHSAAERLLIAVE